MLMLPPMRSLCNSHAMPMTLIPPMPQAINPRVHPCTSWVQASSKSYTQGAGGLEEKGGAGRKREQGGAGSRGMAGAPSSSKLSNFSKTCSHESRFYQNEYRSYDVTLAYEYGSYDVTKLSMQRKKHTPQAQKGTKLKISVQSASLVPWELCVLTHRCYVISLTDWSMVMHHFVIAIADVAELVWRLTIAKPS